MESRPRLGIIGTGTLGASIALAAQHHNYPLTVHDTNPTAISVLPDNATIALTPFDVARTADLIVVAVPYGEVPAVMDGLAPYLHDNHVLTYMVPTPAPLAAREISHGARIIGSHPSLNPSVKGPSPDLFAGQPWVLCPNDGRSVPAPLLQLVLDLSAVEVLVTTPREFERPLAMSNRA